MKKKLLILTILVGFLVVSGLIVAQNLNHNYTISDDKVYFDNEKVYVSATPHTLLGGGWVEFNFTIKDYSGDVDVGLGFDTNSLTPKIIELHDPKMKNETKKYSCKGDLFNYTLNPKHAWCYDFSMETKQFTLLFDGDYDDLDIGKKKITWNEGYFDRWEDMDSSFIFDNYSYGDMNRWYFRENINIQNNKEYTFRVYIENIDSFNPKSNKYWFVIKPSGNTLEQSINSDLLYALDPWTTGVEPLAYWKLEADGTDSTDNGNDFGVGAGATFIDICPLGNCANLSNAPTGFLNVKKNDTMAFDEKDFTLVYWFRSENSNANAMIDSTVSLPTGWGIHDTDKHIFAIESTDIGVKTSGIVDNTWHRIVFTKISTNLTMYVDNETIVSKNTVSNNFSARGNFSISGESTNGYSIDDIGLYKDYGWTVTDVSVDWNGGDGRVQDFDNVAPNITINEPNSTFLTTTFNIDVFIEDSSMDECHYNVTDSENSLVLSKTIFTCGEFLGTDNIATNGQYFFHLFANDTTGNVNMTNSSFVMAIGGGGDDGGGGGGGGARTEDDDEEEKVSICVAFQESFVNALETAKAEPNFLDKVRLVWRAFLDSVLCDSASAIVPI